MIKKIVVFLFFILIPMSLGATAEGDPRSTDVDVKEIIFKSRVLDIIEEVNKESGSGEIVVQQNIRLQGLEGDFKNKEFVFYGIGDIEIIGGKKYSVGDRVLVVATPNLADNSFSYYIIDYVRSSGLVLIFILFFIFLLIVGRWKGFRSIFSLLLTFFVIIFFIVPQIMAGVNPILISFVGSILILLFIIYLTEGFNLRSHLALAATFISLLLVIAISYFFIYITKLTGAFSEDVFILVSIGHQTVNFKGMLLAGMIIGALGVLDDVVISQVASVEQIILANPQQGWREVFKKSYKIGVSHISSMTNTLFLAYAGASLPLLLLFVSPENPFSSFEQIINNEAISTEIVRALSGSLGILLSVPIATFIATWGFFYNKNKVN